MRHYGTIARPLTNLLHHKAFSYSSAAKEAFEQLCDTTPILAFPDFDKEFIVETDACDTSIGVVLTQ
jgi:hypothetical protein